MPTPKKIALIALCLPLALSACSSGAPKSTDGSRPSTSTTSGSPTPGPAFSPGYPVASVYVVTAKSGVTDEDLRNAVSTIGKLAGVESVSLIGTHQLRVEMSLVDLVKRSKPVYDELAALGPVTTA